MERVRGRFDPTTYSSLESRLNEYGCKTERVVTYHRKRVAHGHQADASFRILTVCPLRESEPTCILTKDMDVGPPFRCEPLPRDFEERLTEVDEVYGIKRRYRGIFIHHLYVVTCDAWLMIGERITQASYLFLHQYRSTRVSVSRIEKLSRCGGDLWIS